MNVLITGITGFIGSRLAARLVKDGHNVHGLVRHSSERELSRIREVISQVHLIEGDLGTFHSVLSAVDASEPEIIASTAEVYGWQEGNKPIGEDAILNPASPYAVTKSAADQYVQMANRVYHLKGTVLRPINSYGRTGEGGFYTEYLISKMLAGETCYVGAPDSIRDYMFAEDHVSAYVLAAKSPKAIGQVYNVSPGNPVTNSELAKVLTAMTGFKGKIVFGSYPPGYPQRPKSQDPQYLVLDNSKISKELNWKPSHTLQEGLKLTVEMWRSKNS